MKIKYLRLTKEERQKVKELYYESPKGRALKSKLTMVNVCAFGLLLCAVAIIVEAIVKKSNAWNYIYGGCLGCVAVAFFIVSHKLRLKRLNNYLLNNKLKLK